MAKRFIDTGLFDDPWFMGLNINEKVLWLYCITKCDHAGILELNQKLCQFQTGIKGLLTVIKGLGNRLLRVNDVYYFIPKFLEYQYPNFPNSKVRQQESAIKRLKEFKLFDDSTQRVIKGLANSYEHEHESGNESEPVKKESRNSKIPPYPEFKEYALLNKADVDQEQLSLKYKSWKENGWKDGHNNHIKNWKSKLLNTLPHLVSKFKEPVSKREKDVINFDPIPKGDPMPESLRKIKDNIGK